MKYELMEDEEIDETSQTRRQVEMKSTAKDLRKRWEDGHREIQVGEGGQRERDMLDITSVDM